MQCTDYATGSGPSRQRGLTAISWIFIIALAVFLGMIGLKLVPIYLNHYTIQTVLRQLPEEPFIGDKGPAEIRKSLLTRFKINSIYDFDPNNIKIQKGLRNYTVEVTYTVREPVMGNVDMLVSFSDSVEITPTGP
ncbi:MAG: DUF4845 domain-containing protein [Gammaproteobacteria bacterium]|jgi:hypothetical protein|nr:DUF4845 domain-containing protein [Gammaproteobacteria bacterium]